jgi:hypothetical protein
MICGTDGTNAVAIRFPDFPGTSGSAGAWHATASGREQIYRSIMSINPV